MIINRYVREVGGLCIADEIQVGLGRTGDHWWAFQDHGMLHYVHGETFLICWITLHQLTTRTDRLTERKDYFPEDTNGNKPLVIPTSYN